MRIVYHQDALGNFGDELNNVLWPKLLPKSVLEHPEATLIGIGSIFNAGHANIQSTAGRRVFVLGAGAGYGPLPSNWRNWSILAVRGPLTARVIGRPELAATDAASLLAVTDLAAREDRRDLVLFMPHLSSLKFAPWNEVTQEAGVTFVSPHRPVLETMQLFSRARLVLAEAMHAAIVADALRIPWIPVTTNPNVLPFKWRDWTASLDLPYEPIFIPSSSFEDAVRSRVLHLRAWRTGYKVPASHKRSLSDDQLLEDYHRRYSRLDEAETFSPSRWKNAGATLANLSGLAINSFFSSRAADSLRRAALVSPYLSDELTFHRKLNQLVSAKDVMVRSLSE